MNSTMERLIASTAETWAYLKDPARASGACDAMTFRFVCLAAEAGLQAEHVRCWDSRFIWDTDLEVCTRFLDHHVVLFQGTIIDWTARQFWQGCVFPWVEPIRTYRDKWWSMEVQRGALSA